MTSRFRSLVANLLLVTVSIAVVAVGAEVFLRVFPRFLPPTAALRIHWAKQPTPLSHADGYTGYLYPAHATEHFHAGAFRFDYATDEHGFRNPSPWPDSADVVLVGDSETFGFGVGDDSTWSRMVARALPGMRVINLGLPGMAPKQYLRVYERFGVPLHPKVLMFGLFPGNDLQDEGEFNAWIEAGSPGNFETWKFSHGTLPGLLQRALQHSYLYWTLRESARAFRARRAGSAAASHSANTMVFPDGSHMQFAPSFLASQVPMAHPGAPLFEDVMRSIEQARTTARAQGTAFVVLIFATKEDVYFPLQGDSLPPVRPPFVRALQERGIPYLDLAMPMQEEARKHRQLFFEVDGHPNGAGYRVIADTVAGYLRAHAREFHLPVGQ